MENHDSAVCSGSRDHESVPNLFSMARTMSFKFQLLETVANEHESSNCCDVRDLWREKPKSQVFQRTE